MIVDVSCKVERTTVRVTDRRGYTIDRDVLRVRLMTPRRYRELRPIRGASQQGGQHRGRKAWTLRVVREHVTDLGPTPDLMVLP